MYTRLLEDTMEVEDIHELCICIDCRDMVFPLCFIRSENLKYLIVDSTRDDGTEGVVVIPKQNILSVSVVYEQDVQKIFDGENNKDEKMFG